MAFKDMKRFRKADVKTLLELYRMLSLGEGTADFSQLHERAIWLRPDEVDAWVKARIKLWVGTWILRDIGKLLDRYEPGRREALAAEEDDET